MSATTVIRNFSLISLLLTTLLGSAWAEEPAKEADSAAKEEAARPAESKGPWYFFLGNVNNHPRLANAQEQIHQQIDVPFRLIAPDFKDVRTFADQRDELMIWTPFVGVGRKLSTHWDAFFQVGYSKGKVRTRETDLSLLLLPFHMDMTEYRSSFFAGLGLGYFPLGLPELRKYDGFVDRLKSAKPFLVGTASWNYLTFEAKVKAGLVPIGNFIRIDQKDNWSPFSTGIGAGVDIPLTKSLVTSMNVQYTFFLDQGDDFSGPGISMYWKKFF